MNRYYSSKKQYSAVNVIFAKDYFNMSNDEVIDYMKHHPLYKYKICLD